MLEYKVVSWEVPRWPQRGIRTVTQEPEIAFGIGAQVDGGWRVHTFTSAPTENMLVVTVLLERDIPA